MNQYIIYTSLACSILCSCYQSSENSQMSKIDATNTIYIITPQLDKYRVVCIQGQQNRKIHILTRHELKENKLNIKNKRVFFIYHDKKECADMQTILPQKWTYYIAKKQAPLINAETLDVVYKEQLYNPFETKEIYFYNGSIMNVDIVSTISKYALKDHTILILQDIENNSNNSSWTSFMQEEKEHSGLKADSHVFVCEGNYDDSDLYIYIAEEIGSTN